MSKLLLSLFFTAFIVFFSFGQSENAVYFDQSGKTTSKANSYYYREMKPGSPGVYISKYSNGNIAFEGKIQKVNPSDETRNLYSGICTWYYKNGTKKAVRTYDDQGVEKGKSTYFFESGKVWKVYFWENGKLKDRKYEDYDEKGSGKYVFEEFFKNNSNDWDLYSSNKSKAEIKDNKFILTSLTKSGSSRIIRIDNETNEFSYEMVLVQGKKPVVGKYGMLFGFKDWQNYNYFLIDGQSIYIGDVFEGVNTTKTNGFFSNALYMKPKEINLKVFGTKEKSFFSINGEIQYTSSKVLLYGTGVGPTLGTKGEMEISKLSMKEFNIEGKGKGGGKESSENEDYKSSGTGFLISKEGHVVTNYHVIDDGKGFDVQILENGIMKSYKAKKLVEDKDNDLAILKIDDDQFKPLAKISYAWKSNPGYNVGASVFSIGFPLQDILGKEAKFVDGKISSKTGFKNSISSFQTSVPLQPGNSGSPLFNDKGELIAVMNAIVTNTDNISYAVKLSFLQNLIDLLPTSPDIPNTPFPAGTSLEDMVKVLSSYVTLIKVK